MNILSYWRRKPKENQRKIILYIGLILISALLGFFTGGYISDKKTGYIDKKSFEKKKESLELKRIYKKVSKPPKDIYWLGEQEGYQALIYNNSIFYVKNNQDLSSQLINSAKQLITEKGTRAKISGLFKSFQPVKKLAPGKYYNPNRNIFLWVFKKGNLFFLVRGENFIKDPGDLK